MRFAFILVLLFICLTFFCRKTPEIISPEFDLIESVMWDHPDSALALLEQMPKPAISDELNNATWCLLYTQARDKNYIKHTSDSLINIALQYFDSKKDWRRKAHAWFYKGQVLRDLDNKEEAIRCYVKVKDMLEYFNEPLFASLVCRTLGNLYRYQKLYDLSLVELKEGLLYALQTPANKSLSYSYSELGRTFTECMELDSAQYYFELSLENAELIGDLKTESMAIGDLGVLYLVTKNYEKALSFKKKNYIQTFN